MSNIIAHQGIELKGSISTVIPCYNGASTIRRAVASVINQSVPVEEIIILDDYSSDNSLEIINELQEKYNTIRIYQSPKNCGLAAMRNKGIELAHSKYVAFLDVDDTWHRDKIKYFHQSPECHIWASLVTLKDVPIIGEEHLQITIFHQLIKNHIAGPTAIIHKETINERFDESMRHLEDHDFFIRTAFKHKILLQKAELYRLYRKPNSPGGLSGDNWKMRKAEIKMYWKLYNLTPLFLPFIPLLILYSLLKHMRLLAIKLLHN